MPTTLKRSQITHTPRVEQLIAQGRTRWPDASPATILVNLAAEGARHLPEQDTGNGLMLLPVVPGHRITAQQVEDILDELD